MDNTKSLYGTLVGLQDQLEHQKKELNKLHTQYNQTQDHIDELVYVWVKKKHPEWLQGLVACEGAISVWIEGPEPTTLHIGILVWDGELHSSVRRIHRVKQEEFKL